MHSSTILPLLLSLAATSLSQTVTVDPASQISDGQVQGPTGPGPVSPSETPFITSTTTIPYSNPFTAYLSLTNSLGVVTGMPSVVTSQPSLVTEQPVSPTLPSYSGYAYGNSTTVGVTATTLATVASPSVPPSEPASTEESATGTASATFAQSTGGASMNRVAGCGVALVVLGFGFSML